MLKKFLFVMLVVVLYQNWGKIEHMLTPAAALATHSTAEQHVVLYATDWCGYCKQTRRFLDKQGIAYQEFDIDKSAEGRKLYEALGGRGIPLIDVNGRLIRDFNEQEILAALH